MVYFDEHVLGWRPVVTQWLLQNNKFKKLFPADLDAQLDTMLERTLTFLRSTPGDSETPDIHWVQRFFEFLGAILSADFVDDLIPPAPAGQGSREQEVAAEQAIVAHADFFSMSMAFAFIWSFGAKRPRSPDFAPMFNIFATDLIPTFCPSFPQSTTDYTVYDYCIDYTTMTWQLWSATVPQFQYNPAALEQMVPTVDTTCASYLMRVLVTFGNINVLLTGQSGTAKTSIMREFRRRDDVEALAFAYVPFSARSSAEDFQPFVEGELDQRTKDLLGPPSDTKMVVLVDDLSLPQPDAFATQQTTECVRQLIDSKGFYDIKGMFWKQVVETQIVAARTPHGGGHSEVCGRLLRHFHMIGLVEPADADLLTIFGSLTSGWVESGADETASNVSRWLPTHVEKAASGTIALFGAVRDRLLPTPAKCHYIFNLRNILRVFEGLRCYKLKYLRNQDEFIRLWAHESSRVFADGLSDQEEISWFHDLVASTIEERFEVQWRLDQFVPSHFGAFNISANDRDYRERVIPADESAGAAISDLSKTQMVTDLNDALYQYQLSAQPMELVLFDDVLRHLSATCRVFRQGRGNMLLLGQSGCGRRSVVKLAAHVIGAELFQIRLARGYGLSEFREDLKPLLQNAGVAQRPVVFFLAEGQIIEEDFLRDVSSILETGKVPGLFSDEEMNLLCEDLKQSRPRGSAPDPRPIEQVFADNVLQNLHIVVSLAPVGERYLQWMRIYPALTSWSTIDWYHPWPDSALLAVARSHLGREVEAMPNAEEEEKETLLTDVDQVCQACVGITEAVNTQLVKLPGTALVITPKFFVELLKLFKSMLVEKETRLNNDLQRLRGGLDKLFMCNETVEQMQVDLTNLQPQLEQMAEETISLMGALAHDKEEADRVSALVRRDQNKVEDMTRKCEAIAKAAAKELEDAMPAFHAAVAALNTLDKGHITELKTFKDPPPLVKKTMEAICILKFVEPTWKSAQKILQDFNFLDSLKKYPKDDVQDETRAKLGKYINDPSFNAESVGKVSTACKSLCMWALAIDQYAEVNSHVRPKKARLKEAQDKAAVMQAQLQEKQNELAEVTARLQKLEQDYQDSLAKRDELNNRKDDAKIRIARAETLTTQLADEQARWSRMSRKLESDRGQLVGDTLLAAAFIGYAGAFDVTNRSELVRKWIARAIALKLPVDNDFTLKYTLGDPVELREWKLQGLPQDMFSIENSLVVSNTRRWPLLTDPQGQASAWIKNMEKGNGIQVVKANDPNLLRTVENSIRMGIPVLMENVGESIDPNMRPIYQKQIFSAGGRKVIRLGDVDVDYNPLFKLYMTCNLPNPSYTTDVYTTLTVINFAVSRFDLRDQLLTMVVAHEKPELEEQKDRLILEINKGEKMLNKVEEEILDMLKSASSNILADDDLIQQLDRAKTTSNTVKSQIEEAERTSAEIDKSRSGYETVATRGSVLYFAVANLSSLSPMYHNSLGFFRDLFTQVMKNTKKSKDLDERLLLLTDALTETVFDKVCRGLFEKDKLLFSFIITAKILQERGEVSSQEWDFLVRGIPVQVDGDSTESLPNPCSSWLADSTWEGLLALATLPQMASLPGSIGGSQQEAWRRFRSDPDMHRLPLPSRELQTNLSLFQRLLVIKTLREDALELSVIHFVEKALGRAFIEPTNATVTGCYEDSAAHVPTVFILSPGADPTQMQLSFARTRDMEDRLDFVSLGRGQGPTAEKLIRKGCAGHRWVCLQNCHLFLQWMPHLESLVEQLPELVDENSNFRLWLTSYPAEGFPVPVIQCSVKMANEMPRGLRANLLRTYRELSSSKFDTVVPVKRKLLFSLAFLHAALLDRCTFGSIGFNNPYEWTAADLEISISVLNQELNDSTVEETLTYMIGNVYYGGRVTDPWDQRCVQSLLAKFLKSGRSQIDIPFDEEGRYGCPELCESQPECIKYIMSLPIATDPSVFGLHESADVAFRTNSSEALLEKIVTASQTQTAAKADTRQADNALVLDLTQQILTKLGEPLVISMPADDTNGVDALRIVLEQEVVRYNHLHSTMQRSLGELEKAIDGRGVMTKSLDAVFNALLVLRVPQEWKETISDVSHRALASWATELGQRLDIMREWCASGPPSSFYLPGLVFPQGLLAGIMQQYGRKNDIAIDTLRLHTQATKIVDPDGLRWIPDIARYGGVYIHGLVLEGARWDAEAGLLKDPIADGAAGGGVAGARFSDMPVLWCRPVILRESGSPSPQGETARISTPGPSEDGDSDTLEGEPLPATFTSVASDGASDGTSAAGDLDSEIASLTSPMSGGAAEKSGGGMNSTAGSRKSNGSKGWGGGGQTTPYDRTPTPLPPDTVIYPEPKRSFTCPVYKTAHRGADPGGFVMSCELASSGRADNWVLRGTALMCEG
jgi:dynein heavy chain